VIKLNNEPTSSESQSEGSARPSAGVMFVTILLLISGILLTSVMLFHYSVGGSKTSGESLSKLQQKRKTAASQTNTPAVQASEPVVAPTPPSTPKKKSGFSFKKLFSSPAHWPRLELTGFGLPANGELGFAIINGKHVIEGTRIKEVTLVGILDYGVQVEFNGETKILTIDTSN